MFSSHQLRSLTSLLLLGLVLFSFGTACGRSPESQETATRIDAVEPESGYPQPESAYPEPPTRTLAPSLPYPIISTPVPVISPASTISTASETEEPASTNGTQSFVPNLSGGAAPTLTPSPSPSNTPPPTPTPTIDFKAVRAQLQAQGQDLGFAKIGFHTAVGGNRIGLGEWMHRLDAAGVPFFLKSADDAGPLFDAQQIVRNSDVPHTLVFRRSGNEYDTPNYDLPPREAARQHWQLHLEVFPVELDPELVWIETINEVDKEKSEWLASFALETARLALADGYRWAAFGWSAGEPEDSDWISPPMLEFLRLAGANPDRLAIALHEYSFLADDIAHEYPFKVGRFQKLYEVVDRYGIPRTTILLSEWGWEYGDAPSIDNAMRDIDWAAAMYAPYPEIKGAAIWYLGGGYEEIAEKVQRLIVPLTNYSLGNYFPVPLPPDRAAVDPEQFRP
jgi:hypothetical protein